ncbi:MAG TPA: ribosome silencing factor [Phycisphaerae bacterium]|nr:ribosome silencing factor [Phycisphaerae bacterium]
MGGHSAEQLAIEIARVANEQNAEDVTVMDLRGLSPVTDFFVICSGTSGRQLQALCDTIRECARKVGERAHGVAGYDVANWVLVDFINVMVHIFTPEHRQYYDLELLWGDAPRIDWTKSASA